VTRGEMALMRNHAEVVAEAGGMGYTHVLTADGPVALADWAPYGLPGEYAGQLAVRDGKICDGAITERPSGIWVLLRDVSEYARTSHRTARVKPPGFEKVQPSRGLTPARERVLRMQSSTRLPFVHCPVFWGDTWRSMPKTEHKMLVGLFYGGYLSLFEVLGNLPGSHLPSRVGAQSGRHFLLARVAAEADSSSAAR